MAHLGNGDTEPLPTPAPASVDAPRRAWRTFMQGLLASVAIWIGPILLTAAHQVAWTRAYWVALGLNLAGAAVTAVMSYIARFLVPPATG